MGKKWQNLIVFSIVLLLFLPAVAIGMRLGDAGRNVLCRSVSQEKLMEGKDEPGKLRIYLIPGDKVDINHADARQLELLPGVGELLAERIVLWRQNHGPFEKAEDIMLVDGIDQAVFEAMAHIIYAGDTI